MRHFPLILIFLFACFSSGFSQRQQDFSTEHAIFKLTNHQTKKLLLEKVKVDSTYFENLVRTYDPVDDEFNPQELPHGNYLDVSVEQTNLVIEFFSVQNITPFIIGNETDLLIEVHDKLGQSLNNIEVKLKQKQLRYDAEVKAYRLKKNNRDGLLTINYKGVDNFYLLDRQYDRGNFKRVTRKVLYGTPIKHIARPIRYVIHLPIDGYKSIRDGRIQGSISTTVKPVGDIVRSFEYDEPQGWVNDFVCFFATNAFYCEEKDYVGYMTFSKPKYRPEDTIQLKAFIVKDIKGTPVKKPLDVVLKHGYSGGRESIKLATIEPYRPGGYTFAFTIHDSLNMKLDNSYRIYLEDENHVYEEGRFKYEDYDLFQNHFSVSANSYSLEPKDSLKIYLSAKDENDLALFDIDYDLTIRKTSISNQSPDSLYTPHLLFEKQGRFSDTLTINVPDSIFTKSDIKAQVWVRFKDAANEYQEQSLRFDYNHKIDGIVHHTEKDSLFIQLKKEGVDQKVQAKILDLDRFSYTLVEKEVQLPYSHPLNPMAASYLVKIGDEIEEIAVESNSNLSFNGQHHLGKASIQSTNPKNVSFQYFIYEGNQLLQEGVTKSLQEEFDVNSNKAVTLIVNHVWQGENRTEKYVIKSKKNLATITVDAPPVAYPGQEITMTVKAIDHNEKGINNMDITAQAYKSSFNTSAARLPFFPSRVKYKHKINEFSLTDIDEFQTEEGDFVYEQWRDLFGLDSLAFYRIRNPKKAITKHFTFSADSITQFTPIVVKDGKVQQTIAVELDRVPVYFGFVDMPLPYVFRVSPKNKHHLYIRLAERAIELDSLQFQENGKTLLVIDLDKLSQDKVSQKPAQIEGKELNQYKAYLFRFRKNRNRFARIEQDQNIFLLNRNGYSQLSGPIAPRYFTYKDETKSYSLQHEPSFEYEFLPELVKMRTMALPEIFRLYNMVESMPLDHKIMTQDSLVRLKEKHRVEQITRTYFTGMNTLQKGDADLLIEKPRDSLDQQIRYTLLFSPQSDTSHIFLRGGKQSNFQSIKDGNYQIFYLTDSLIYTTEQPLMVKASGQNFFRIHQWMLAKHKVAKDVHLLLQHFMRDEVITPEEEDYMKSVATQNNGPATYVGPTRKVYGVVLDENGDPIIGATVRVPNTNIGSISGIEGEYVLEVPVNIDNLSISYVGYDTEVIALNGRSHVDFELSANLNMLESVVVTAYGATKRKKSLGYATATVSGDDMGQALEGKVAGIAIVGGDGEAGQASSVRVRGLSSFNTNQQPLYIIDGVIYNGSLTDLEAHNFASIEVIKDASATALYGSRAANGMILITTKGGIKELNLPGTFEELPKPTPPQPQLQSSLRDNFSDVGFWRPKLTTNHKGEATFSVTLPDDVTKWDAHFLAMNGKKQSGQFSTSIRSYKPILAELHAPRFFTEGDQINIVGELNNYTDSLVNGQATFTVDSSQVILSQQVSLDQHESFDVTFSAQKQDSVTLLYQYEVPELGFMDGEKRKLPVNRKGTLEQRGNFYRLYKDSTILLDDLPNDVPITLNASASTIEIAKQEVQYLKNYRHLCNEQLSSKLYAYLWDKKLTELKGETYEHHKEINQIIARLEKGKNSQNIWGWWPDNTYVPWINQHVIKALIFAKQEGYNIPNLDDAERAMVFELEKMGNNPRRVMDIVESLSYLESPINYSKYLDSLSIDTLQYENRLRREWLRKKLNLEYNAELVKRLSQRDMLGNYKLKIPTKKRYWYYPASREFELNLYGYQLTDDENLKHGMLTNLLSQRNGLHYRNTYQSSLMLDLLASSQKKNVLKGEKTTLMIENGSDISEVDTFPYQSILETVDGTKIMKSGPNDVYLSASYEKWIAAPEAVDSLFKISTTFLNQEGGMITSLTKGEKVTLKVEVEALYDAKYVMISVPIPSSCQYQSKRKGYIENYREHYKDETLIFIENFPVGIRSFEIQLLPKFSGSFTLNPAKAELMYAPVKFGRNGLGTIEVK